MMARAATRRRITVGTRSRLGLVGAAGLLAIALVVLAGPLFLRHDPIEVNVLDRLTAPSSEYPLGTDYLGRDLLSRLVEGGRRTLGIALLVMGTVVPTSVGLGMFAGLAPRWLDAVVARALDMVLAVPNLVLALALIGALGPSTVALVVALGASQSALYVRVVRAQTATLKEQAYVRAARVHGAPLHAIATRHLLPAIAGQVAVLASVDLGSVILTIAGLNFLGLGVQPPLPEWGAMLNDGRLSFSQRPLLMIAPGLAIFLTVLCANLVGDALRDRFDPTAARTRGAR
jgi:ABC-type dipeptide/oligopeptide/nickel transport system permease subunit